MKKIILLCFVLFTASALAEQETYSMTFKLKDGRKASYAVNNIRNMTFGSTSVEDLLDMMTVEEKVSLCSGDFTHSLSFSYKVDYQMSAIWAHPLFPYVAFAGDLLLDGAPVVNEWKEVKVNLNDAFTSGHYWGVSRDGAMLRFDFNPITPGTPNIIEIKDIKLIPNP